MILCTLCKFEEAMKFNNNNPISDNINGVKDRLVKYNKLNNDVSFYMPEYCSSMTLNNLASADTSADVSYLFTRDTMDLDIYTLLSYDRGRINPPWILLYSQSTVDLFCSSDLIYDLRVVGGT